MADIGIDLGTTNSVVAFLRGGPEVISIRGKQLLPSVVALDEGDFVVGYGAKSLAASIADVVVSPKRSMGTDKQYKLGGKTYTPVDISAMILAEIKKHAEQFLGEPVDSAIVTVPAHFSQKMVEDTKLAAEQAGLKLAQLLAEPVAAAATYGSGSDETILVFDMGGGTLDCTVVDMFDNQIKGLDGDNWLGGDNFDERIVDRMCEELKAQGLDVSQDKQVRQKMKMKAELNKINLSEMNSTQVEFSHTAGGKTYAIDFRLTRKEYNGLIGDLVDRAVEKALQAVSRSGLEKEDIDVILLVGGSTLTPYVQQRLEETFGKKPSTRVDPMLAVAMGAAVCTRDIAVNPGEHRVKLRSRAEVWSEPQYTIKGRTTPGSKIEITGGAAPVDTTAGTDGLFSAAVALNANAVNDLVVVATNPKGESAKAMHRVRHDAKATQAQEPEALPPLKPALPRSFSIGTTGRIFNDADNFVVATIVEAGRILEATGELDQFSCSANPAPFTLQIPVYEGHDPQHEIPVGQFNTQLGILYVKCPATPQETQLVIAFDVDTSRNLFLRCWFKHDPSVSGEIRLNMQSLSKDKLHLIDRTEQAVNNAGNRIRPDEKARINRKKQALIDLSGQFHMQPSEPLWKQVIATGIDLRNDVASLEQRLNL